MTMNENPVVEFDLEVAAGGTPYDATIQQVTSQLTVGQYTPGAVVACKVDPSEKSEIVLVNPEVSGS